jgi:hypothetical protein
MKHYNIETIKDIVYITETIKTSMDIEPTINNFQFDLHVFTGAIGIDVLLASTKIEDDDNFIALLDEYRDMEDY